MNIKIANEPKVTISEDMYGLFFEDINYGLDGGLHAEMLENRMHPMRRRPFPWKVCAKARL